MKTDLKKLILSNVAAADAIQQKLDIDQYVDKIAEKATIIPYYNESNLEGLIAFYANDVLQNEAYLTLLIVNSTSKGKGLGKMLLQFSIRVLQQKNFRNYKLEVAKNNQSAFLLYQNTGFVIDKETNDDYLMNLKL